MFNLRLLVGLLSLCVMLVLSSVSFADEIDQYFQRAMGQDGLNQEETLETLNATQEILLRQVIEALKSSTENRDLAAFLKANFPGNKMMREAAQNLRFGRYNPHLAERIELWLNRHIS